MTALLAGLADPVLESQHIFRTVLDALARPASLHTLAGLPAAPAPLAPATAAVLLALADTETPVWLDGAARTEAVCGHLRFHCGCPLVPMPAAATFAVIAAPQAMPPLAAFAQGSDQYPDRSATVLIQVPSLTDGPTWRLSGPGIRDHAHLSPAGLPADFPRWLADNHAGFPLGIDILFTCGDRLTALPRSTRLEG